LSDREINIQVDQHRRFSLYEGREKMTLLEFLVLLVIAAISGAIGQALAGYSLGGLVITTLVGFVGAWLGTWIARATGLPELLVINVGGEPFPIIWAIIGSAILAAVVAILTRSPRRYA
jgi:uncharacterized membrane protein YeaQ/YmgE (transglycosylase-associated protein family)